MTNCWAILEIPPTHDVEEIRKARRALIRKWHPDLVEDPASKDEYTIRCAQINAAHDEAVRFAETTGRVYPGDFGTGDAGGGRSHSRTYRSEFTYRVFSQRAAAFAILYMLAFRVTLPLTIFAIIFGMGLLVAAVVDLILYYYLVRPVLSRVSAVNHGTLPWTLLMLANVGVSYLLQPGHAVFHAGVLLAIPLWRLRRWSKAQRPGRTEAAI